MSEREAGELKRQWNGWLLSRYGSRQKLQTAWSTGEEPLGEQMLRDGDFQSLHPERRPGDWNAEIQGKAMMAASFDRSGAGDGKPRGAVINGAEYCPHAQRFWPAAALRVRGRRECGRGPRR